MTTSTIFSGSMVYIHRTSPTRCLPRSSKWLSDGEARRRAASFHPLGGAPEPTASGCRRLPPSSGGGRPCGCWADYVRVQADPWQPLLLERLIAALELSMKQLEALMLSDEWDSIPRHRQRRLAEALEDVRVDTEQLNLALKLSP